MYLGEVQPATFDSTVCTPGAIPFFPVQLGIGVGFLLNLMSTKKNRDLNRDLAMGAIGGFAVALGMSLYYQRSGKC